MGGRTIGSPAAKRAQSAQHYENVRLAKPPFYSCGLLARALREAQTRLRVAHGALDAVGIRVCARERALLVLRVALREAAPDRVVARERHRTWNGHGGCARCGRHARRLTRGIARGLGRRRWIARRLARRVSRRLTRRIACLLTCRVTRRIRTCAGRRGTATLIVLLATECDDDGKHDRDGEPKHSLHFIPHRFQFGSDQTVSKVRRTVARFYPLRNPLCCSMHPRRTAEVFGRERFRRADSSRAHFWQSA